MKLKPFFTLSIATALLLTGCTSGGAQPTPDAGGNDESTGLVVDAAAERISEEAAEAMSSLYEEALANNENEINLLTASLNEMEPIFRLFEEEYPGIKVTGTQLIGGALTTQLQTEKDSGQYKTDILQNPRAEQYLDLAEPYEVLSLTVPEALKSSTDQLVDPEHRYSSPFFTFFGLGVFLPRAESSGLTPKLWSDLAKPEYKSQVGFPDPTVPGAGQEAVLYLLRNGALTRDDVVAMAENSIVKGTFGDAIAGLMQGEYPFMFAAPSGSIVESGEKGAPVEFRIMDEDNYIVTHKHMLMQGAPAPHASKLYLEFLNTFTAQTALASEGITPLDVDAASDYVEKMPWVSWETANVDKVESWQELEADRPEVVAWLTELFG